MTSGVVINFPRVVKTTPDPVEALLFSSGHNRVEKAVMTTDGYLFKKTCYQSCTCNVRSGVNVSKSLMCGIP